MNTAFVTSNFVGGAIGSAVAGALWHVGGWWAVVVGGCVVLGVALVVCGGSAAGRSRRSARPAPPERGAVGAAGYEGPMRIFFTGGSGKAGHHVAPTSPRSATRSPTPT